MGGGGGIGGIINSVVSPVTDIVGGVTGNVAGGLGLTVKTPQGASVDKSKFLANDDEKALAEELKRRYLGDGPTVAQNALKQANDRNIANLAGTAAAQNGNQALIARSLLQSQAGAQQQTANQMAQLRAQEMQDSQQAYQQQVQSERQGRGEAEATGAGIAIQSQGLQNQTASGNANRIGGLLGGAGQAIAASDATMKTNIATVSAPKQKYEEVVGQSTKAGEEGNAVVGGKEKAKKVTSASDLYARNEAIKDEDTKAGAQVGTSMALAGKALSDETKKTDKQSAKKSDGLYEDFIGNVKAKTFEYTDPSAPGASEGRKLGVMAQDLEKSEIGKQMVFDTPNGKMVDFAKAIAPMLAVQSVQNEEIENLKKALQYKAKKGSK